MMNAIIIEHNNDDNQPYQTLTAHPIKKELPKHIPRIFISSITGKGLAELKDLLWKVLNDQSSS